MEKKLINFRMTKSEKKALEQRAKQMGMKVSAYLRYVSTLKIEGSLTDKMIKGGDK